MTGSATPYLPRSSLPKTARIAFARQRLRLSKWAERYEREQGKIRCGARERNNKRREAGERVVDGSGHSGGRFRRERMSPQREPRETIPAEREGPERERVAWQRAGGVTRRAEAERRTAEPLTRSVCGGYFWVFFCSGLIFPLISSPYYLYVLLALNYLMVSRIVEK